MTHADFYWLIGWLEGEGSFTAGSPSAVNNARISGVTKDLDTAKRVGALFERKVGIGSPPLNPNHSQMYHIKLQGKPARDLMRSLYPHMSQRRRSQIRHAVNSYCPPDRPNGGAALTYDQADKARALLASGHSRTKAGQILGVTRHVLRGIEHRYFRPDPEDQLAAEH